jgi:uncharacterized protein YdhG (YjbR/CyaY superfamily)
MKSDTKKPTKSKAATFSAEERAAMRERAKEQKAEAGKVEGESAVLAKIAEMSKSDRDMAKRLHGIIKANAPDLTPRLWYGQPAYARDGKVVCFFQPADKFKTRYGTLGFSDEANLDDGGMWPTAFGIGKLTDADEKKIGALVRKAVS